jgi:hypothetical protein
MVGLGKPGDEAGASGSESGQGKPAWESLAYELCVIWFILVYESYTLWFMHTTTMDTIKQSMKKFVFVVWGIC